MSRSPDAEIKRLRLVIALIFLSLALPTGMLVWRAYSQLRWEAVHQYQLQAAELTERINRQIDEVIRSEEQRASTEYGFLMIDGGSNAQAVQLSPLAIWPPASDIAGLLGHFQVDANGSLQAPFVPPDSTTAGQYAIGADELVERAARRRQLVSILAENQLITRQRVDAQPREGRDKFVAETEAPATPGRSVDSPAALLSADPAADSNRNYSAGSYPTRNRAKRDYVEGDYVKGEYVEDEVAKRIDSDDESQVMDLVQTPAFQDDTAYEQKAVSGLGRVSSLNLDARYQQARGADASAPLAKDNKLEQRRALAPRVMRKERSTVPAPAGPVGEFDVTRSLSDAPDPGDANQRIRMFDSEITPFQMRLLGSGHFVLYREVWRGGDRLVQGALIDSTVFINNYIASAMQQTALGVFSDLLVAWQDEVVSVVSAQQSIDYFAQETNFAGTELYSSRLTAPLDDMALIFSFAKLPVGAGAGVLNWLSAILALVLSGGFVVLYYLGLRQLALARQQQDFVSAVSHELKTPLTSIRMYGEILQAGWADEDRKQEYYQFIHDEAERLSRLISNVLQLARINRNELQLELRPVTCQELLDMLQSKLATQIAQAEFTLQVDIDETCREMTLDVDADAVAQIMINLVDNALKFAKHAVPRQIDIQTRALTTKRLRLSVRDYGPGIPEKQRGQVFELFFRAGSELTRETAGTGIGLALVHQLVTAMGGEISVHNCNPGAEFRLELPALATN